MSNPALQKADIDKNIALNIQAPIQPQVQVKQIQPQIQQPKQTNHRGNNGISPSPNVTPSIVGATRVTIAPIGILALV